jgi:hypothetical protein
MESGKTRRYLKYAIGEIILVVIGILIALQINNWNNNRINTNREVGYIKSIERDLNNQLKAIEIQTNYEATIADQCIIALKPYNDNNQLKIDSTFAVALGTIASRRTFVNTNPAYTELISSGNIELLKNETFKNELINYYQELERIERVIAGNNSLYTDQEFTPAMMQFGVLDTREDLKNIFRGYKNQYKITNLLTPANVNRLLAISKKQLDNEENELLFINHLSARYDYAMVHIYFLIEFKVRTEKLLKAVKDY